MQLTVSGCLPACRYPNPNPNSNPNPNANPNPNLQAELVQERASRAARVASKASASKAHARCSGRGSAVLLPTSLPRRSFSSAALPPLPAEGEAEVINPAAEPES